MPRVDPPEARCSWCHGYGWVTFRGPDAEKDTKDCLACDGTGRSDLDRADEPFA